MSTVALSTLAAWLHADCPFKRGSCTQVYKACTWRRKNASCRESHCVAGLECEADAPGWHWHPQNSFMIHGQPLRSPEDAELKTSGQRGQSCKCAINQ